MSNGPEDPAAPEPRTDAVSAGAVPPVPAAPPAAKLTPEEQMALFEKDLKENDWGHQPC
jgi:hypothetical protein